MQSIKILLVLLVCGFVISCSPTYGVKSVHDKEVKFKDFKTYDWMKVQEETQMNEKVVQRVQNAVNKELKAKGLMMRSDDPDFFIAQHVGKRSKVQVSDYGYGYRPHREDLAGYGGGWNQKPTTRSYDEGVLILDFVDPQSKEMIWRGSIKADLHKVNTEEKRIRLINEAVKKILARFPPTS